MAEPDLELVGTAPDAYVAREKILTLRPDVMTLDIEMPRMDGLTFLKRLMRHHPIPTIVISALGERSCAATLEALRYGAVDVIAKPSGPHQMGDLRLVLPQKIRGAASARPWLQEHGAAGSAAMPIAEMRFDPAAVIAIGASTGGTVAIQDILMQLPLTLPGVVVTQHIPAGFSSAFANRLNRMCGLEVKEAEPGDVVRAGRVLVAPGDYHLILRRANAGYIVALERGPQVCYQRPSVDVMFASVAECAGAHAVGVLLTGMGADGAQGMLALRNAGATTIGQDEASCVVYGMPKEAVRLGGVGTVAALADIPRVLCEAVQQPMGSVRG
jgi:two-component system chemotaxis response regulator CheB